MQRASDCFINGIEYGHLQAKQFLLDSELNWMDGKNRNNLGWKFRFSCIDSLNVRDYNVITCMEESQMNTVRTQIIKIDNSRGIRIPKTLIDQVKLGNEVEIVVQRGHLVIRPVYRPRSGWEEQFRAMAEHGDDQLLDKPVSTK